MEFQISGDVAHYMQSVAFATLFFGVVFFFPKLMHKGRLSKLPALNTSAHGEKQGTYWFSSSRQLYAEGYQKVCTVVL